MSVGPMLPPGGIKWLLIYPNWQKKISLHPADGCNNNVLFEWLSLYFYFRQLLQPRCRLRPKLRQPPQLSPRRLFRPSHNSHKSSQSSCHRAPTPQARRRTPASSAATAPPGETACLSTTILFIWRLKTTSVTSARTRRRRRARWTGTSSCGTRRRSSARVVRLTLRKVDARTWTTNLCLKNVCKDQSVRCFFGVNWKTLMFDEKMVLISFQFGCKPPS